MFIKNDRNSGQLPTGQSVRRWLSLHYRHLPIPISGLAHIDSTRSDCSNRFTLTPSILHVVVLLIGTLLIPLRAWGGETVDALVIEQKSQTSGLMKVYFPAHAIRIDFKKIHCTLTASAPDWNIWIFNQSKRVYSQTTYNNYRGFVKDTLMSMWESQTKRTWVPCGKTTVAGIDATQYRVNKRPNEELTKSEADAMMCLATNLKSVDPTAANILCKTVLAPTLGKVPISCDLTRSMFGEQTHRFLSTLRSTREKVPSTLFDKPSGFRKVKSDTEVTDDGSSDGAEQLLF